MKISEISEGFMDSVFGKENKLRQEQERNKAYAEIKKQPSEAEMMKKQQIAYQTLSGQNTGFSIEKAKAYLKKVGCSDADIEKACKKS